MGRCEKPWPSHESPRAVRIRELVDALVTDDSKKMAYVLFANELMAAQRRLAPRRTYDRGFPDYSMSTKRIVARWFGRGLSGRLLWLIGSELIPKPEVFHG